MEDEQKPPVRYRADDIERLIVEHHAQFAKVPRWRMPEHKRAETYTWLRVDSPRGPVRRSLQKRWGDSEDPLSDTLCDLEDGTASWVCLGWRASYSSHEWVYVPSDGWRDLSEGRISEWLTELRLASTPLGVLEFMRDLDAGCVALGRQSDLDLVLALST